ncbi:MAG: CAP domain-containing protein, partial [Acidimicrobiales bacterium]
NQDRAAAGLAPLQMSGGARSVARAWSGYMAGNGMAHNPDLSGDLARAGVSGWSTIGENVGYGSSVDHVHGMFMGSGGHRANILKAAYSQVGIGVVRSGGTVWVTLDFVGY